MSAVAKLQKPQMRGLLHKQIGRNLVIATLLSIAGGVAYKYLISEPRKARYAEFYRTYDIEKTFNEIREKGLFDSAK